MTKKELKAMLTGSYMNAIATMTTIVGDDVRTMRNNLMNFDRTAFRTAMRLGLSDEYMRVFSAMMLAVGQAETSTD